MRMELRRIVPLLALVAGLALVAQPALAADIVINNVDFPGEGFNDPTPAAPVGGNSGVTLGEQRLAVFQAAADIWGATLESDVTIVVQGINVPLPCSPTAGVLGAAGTIQIFADLDPAPPGIRALTWYHSALYNKITGADASPGPPDPDFLVPPFNDDIFALFNTELGTPACLTDSGWYYGLDNNAPANQIDFLTVVLHEFAHGLGFSEFIDEDTGEGPLGLPDIYSSHMLDTTQGKTWDQLTPAERLASQTNTGNLVWAGAHVTEAAPDVLGPRPTVAAFAPFRLWERFEAQEASFGPPLRVWRGPTGKVKLVNDGTGDSPTDACEPLENHMWGRIALIDRGRLLVHGEGQERAGCRRSRCDRGQQRARWAGAHGGQRRLHLHPLRGDLPGGRRGYQGGPQAGASPQALRQVALEEASPPGLRPALQGPALHGRGRPRWKRAPLRTRRGGAGLVQVSLGHQCIAEPPHGALHQ